MPHDATLANARSNADWNANIVPYAVNTGEIVPHAPSKWTASNLDGALERLARKIAMMCGFGDVLDDSCVSVARKIRKDVSALAALEAYKRLKESNHWFYEKAAQNPPGWQYQYIVAEVKRYRAQAETKERERAADRAAFAHGTQEHLAWLEANPKMRGYCKCWGERDAQNA